MAEVEHNVSPPRMGSILSDASDSTARVKRVPVPPLIDFSSNPFSDDASIGTSLNPFADPEPNLVAGPSRLSTASSLLHPESQVGNAPGQPVMGNRLSTSSSLAGQSYAPSEAGPIGCAMWWKGFPLFFIV